MLIISMLWGTTNDQCAGTFWKFNSQPEAEPSHEMVLLQVINICWIKLFTECKTLNSYIPHVISPWFHLDFTLISMEIHSFHSVHMMLTLCSTLPAFIALNCNGSLLQLAQDNISLILRPPPFLPSACVHNNTQEQNVILWIQTGGKHGGGLETRLYQ